MAKISDLKSIFLITLSCYFIGSAVLFGIIGGFSAFILSPLLAVFGWPYFIVAFIYVNVMWLLFETTWVRNRRYLFVISISLLGGIGMSLLGIGEIDKQELWRIAYFLGGAVSTGTSAFIVTKWKS